MAERYTTRLKKKAVCSDFGYRHRLRPCPSGILIRMPQYGSRVLLIDDDEQLVALLAVKLKQAGYVVDEAISADLGYKLAINNEYDTIILDIIMPRRSGIEICSSLRLGGVLTPILMLSGRTDKNVVVRGLEAGADDYLTKPFSGNELLARIKALQRRDRRTFEGQLVQKYGIQLDVLSNVSWYGKDCDFLTKKETLLLKRLMSEAPTPVLRSALLQDVWGIGSTHASNRLDVYIRRLRTKLNTLCGTSHIHTIRGRGYYFGKV
jgi:DNA-binding response OmpR family regulator